MNDAAFFAPLARLHASDEAWEYAAERLVTAWEEGEFTPCRACDLYVTDGELDGFAPCGTDVEQELEVIAEEGVDAAIDAYEYERDYGGDYY